MIVRSDPDGVVAPFTAVTTGGDAGPVEPPPPQAAPRIRKSVDVTRATGCMRMTGLRVEACSNREARQKTSLERDE